MGERTDAVEDCGYASEAGVHRGGVIQGEDTLLQFQLPGQRRQSPSIPSGQDGRPTND